jgi:hypothetical protein
MDASFDVVIDYVTFPSEAEWLVKELANKKVKVFYVVLMVDEEMIKQRDQSRDSSIQMGERSVILLNEFKQALKDNKHVLNTQQYSVDQMDEVINEILNNSRFLLGEDDSF